MSAAAARLTLALALALAPAASAGQAPGEGTASGTFEDESWKLDLGGAYAFWDKSRGSDGDARRIQVAVSNAEFLTEALDEHYDKSHAISTLFADEETKVVYFELDASGGYHGLSYYFGPGSGCGWCFSSAVKSTVKAAAGRLKGRISYRDDDSIRFDVSLDVPIPPKEWGEPLPKDGGAPGKAFLAYAAALEKRDQKQIYALLDSAMKERFQEYEKEGRLEGWLDWRWTDEHTSLSTIRITGGYERGDRAVVLFDGANSYIEKLHGEAILRREGGAWLFHKDMVAVGAR